MALLLPLEEASEVDAQNLVTRQILILRGLESAYSLVGHMKNFSSSQVVETQYSLCRLTLYPKLSFASLIFATVFLLRMFVYNRGTSKAHRERAIQGIFEAHKIYRNFQNHREAARVAQWIGVLLDEARSAGASLESLSLSEFVITNCLGASLMRDTILCIRLRAQREQRHNGNRQTQGDNILYEIETNDLPHVPEMRSQLLRFELAFDSLLALDQEQTGWTSWDTCMNDLSFMPAMSMSGYYFCKDTCFQKYPL